MKTMKEFVSKVEKFRLPESDVVEELNRSGKIIFDDDLVSNYLVTPKKLNVETWNKKWNEKESIG
jgi:hypothetical protein